MHAMTLSPPLTELGLMGKRLASRLRKLGIATIEHLLYHFPFRYEDWSRVAPIKNLTPGMQATVSATVQTISFRPGRWRIKPATEALLKDQNGDSIRAVWFNAPYLVKTLPPGTALLLSGKIDRAGNALRLTHPMWEKSTTQAPTHTARLVPIYHTTATLSQKQIRALISIALKRVSAIPDSLPSWIRASAKLIPLDQALRTIHFPSSWANLSAAQTRLKFDELFFLQLRGALARHELTTLRSISIPFNESLTRSFVARLPFKLTTAQRKATWEIIKDLGKDAPMNRLLEGDVGSGKTVAAAIAALNVVAGGFQVAYLAPTAILAAQQFETFCRLFTHPSPPCQGGGKRGVSFTIALITQGDIRLRQIQNPKLVPSQVAGSKIQNDGNYEKISKHELAIYLQQGKINIAIGTHALLSEYVQFNNLALVIVDEQHRFGVKQRHALLRGSTQIDTQVNADGAFTPHLLSMTATPIPRSLALVAYADLDLSIINERPLGRAPITTKIIPAEYRKDAYELIHQELAAGHQAFIICPLIDPSDSLGVKSVKEESERLQREHFPHAKLAALHGRMAPQKKDAIMKDFAEGKIQVLVSTPVVEVGIDVPNATVILIESAERFGLAQLHQLRGRVGRSTYPSWCLLATDTEQEEALKRLHAVVTSRDGFALAEIDLAMRGPGEVYGTEQSGFLDTLKIAKLTDVIILKQSKDAVDRLLSQDPCLERHPALQKQLATLEQTLHLE
ncbi:MAG: ATP-dependent DNA helicase RecG [Patescibacteria group bacterium]